MEKKIDEFKMDHCPFCGSKSIYITTEAGYLDCSTVIFCDSCKISVKVEDNDQEGFNDVTKMRAVKAWNKRAEVPDIHVGKCSEKPNGSDLIDRQVAIDAIDKKADEMYKTKQMGATYPHDDFFQGMAYAEDVVKHLPSAEPVKAYTKADYIMALHKEYGCTLIMAEEAHNKALEYLQGKARMKG